MQSLALLGHFKNLKRSRKNKLPPPKTGVQKTKNTPVFDMLGRRNTTVLGRLAGGELPRCEMRRPTLGVCVSGMCMCLCMCVCMCVYEYLRLYVYLYVYEYVYVCFCFCVFVCVFVCACGCICVYLQVCVWLCYLYVCV